MAAAMAQAWRLAMASGDGGEEIAFAGSCRPLRICRLYNVGSNSHGGSGPFQPAPLHVMAHKFTSLRALSRFSSSNLLQQGSTTASGLSAWYARKGWSELIVPQASGAGTGSGVMALAQGDTTPFDGLLVSWKPGTSLLTRTMTRSSLGLSLREASRGRGDAGILEWLSPRPGTDVEQALSRLNRFGAVAFAEKNYEVSTASTSGVMGGPVGAKPAGASSATPAFDGLLVSWKPGSVAADRASARAALGLRLRETIETAAMRSSGAGLLEWVSLPSGLSAERAISRLSQRPGVAFAEKNWLLESQAVSNDPYVTNGSLWGLYGPSSSPSNAFGSRAIEAWNADQTGSASVYVGIIDEGYQFAHPDLSANAATNPGEIAGNGLDDDANGLVDDVYGWDFVSNDNTVYDGTGDDHGTHVAGTIGARGGNAAGVAGVNWTVSLLSGKFLGANGGSTTNAIKAVDYFTNLKSKGVNIVATNNSWGGGGYSQALFDAIQRANNADILFIAAAGNGGSDGIGDNNDTTANYPSNYSNPNVIAVAAITSSGSRSGFSNYGATTVDLGAPGSGIWSTLPSNTYGSYSGTSMATPHVTGAAALLKSVHPSATAAQIKQALLESAAPTSSLAGITVSGGRLDIPAAITRLGQLTGGGVTLPQISVTASDASAAEPGSDTGSFQLSRTGDTTAELVVNVLWQGTASNGSDYTSMATTVTFAVDSATADVLLNPLDDLIYEGSETVILRLATGSGYTLSTTAASASVTIADNEPMPLEYWGGTGNDTITGDATDNIIGGVTKSGTDTGRGTWDVLTGGAGGDTFVLADALRGSFYNDGISKDPGSLDFAQITDFKPAEGDKLQLRSSNRYWIRNNGSNTELFIDSSNPNSLDKSDEYVGLLQGVTLASSSTPVLLSTNTAWARFV